jgi:hypothetical protein
MEEKLASNQVADRPYVATVIENLLSLQDDALSRNFDFRSSCNSTVRHGKQS